MGLAPWQLSEFILKEQVEPSINVCTYLYYYYGEWFFPEHGQGPRGPTHLGFRGSKL